MGSKYPLGASQREVSADVVLTTLDRLLSHDRLRLSDRNKRFLKFVVCEVLAGRGDRIKAYTIGVDVFGRGPDFDPSNDPIVRIEATRIRTALSTYYEKFGEDEPVKFMMPPGGYAPILEVQADDRSRLSTAPEYFDADLRLTLDEIRPRPVVELRIKVGPGRPANGLFCEMSKQAVAARLHAMHLRVFLGSSQEQAPRTRAMEQLLLGVGAVYALEGAFYSIADDHLQSWSLSDLRTGELLDAIFEMRLEKLGLTCETVSSAAERAAGMVERCLAIKPSYSPKRLGAYHDPRPPLRSLSSAR